MSSSRRRYSMEAALLHLLRCCCADVPPALSCVAAMELAHTLARIQWHQRLTCERQHPLLARLTCRVPLFRVRRVQLLLFLRLL